MNDLMMPGLDLKHLQTIIRENKCDAIHSQNNFEHKTNLFIERQLVNGTHTIFRHTLQQWITEQQALLREISLEKQKE